MHVQEALGIQLHLGRGHLQAVPGSRPAGLRLEGLVPLAARAPRAAWVPPIPQGNRLSPGESAAGAPLAEGRFLAAGR